MVDRFAYVWLVLGEPFELEPAVETLTSLYCRALGLDGEAAIVEDCLQAAEPRR
jgi:hypothetical protein